MQEAAHGAVAAGINDIKGSVALLAKLQHDFWPKLANESEQPHPSQDPHSQYGMHNTNQGERKAEQSELESGRDGGLVVILDLI